MHPVAFYLGGLSIHWYGVLVALAFVLSLYTATRRGLRDNFSPEVISDVGLWLIIGTVVGARTLFVVTYWKEDFAGEPIWKIFNIRQGGLVFYGGFIGCALATILFAWRRKLPLWKLADVLAPSVALGFGIGRIGCLMHGCCYGKACDLPWAIHFPADHYTLGQGVHPTQIYDFIWAMGLYGGLAWLYRRKKFDGQVFAAFMAGYAILRSCVEMFRGDYGEKRLGLLTPAQLVSIAVVLAAGWLYWSQSRKQTIPMPGNPSPKSDRS
jgi:phosphatidylglycerol:prolipoprotein diacylglycerol transferase